MVRADEAVMGQMGLCAVSAPLTDSLPPAAADTHPSNGAATEVQASLSSILASNCSIDPEELVRKLCSIINENYELKETITQNNLAIRQQLGLLERWNKQIDEQQQLQKQALNDATKRMMILQQENALLRATLANSNGLASEGSKFKEFDETVKSLNNRLEDNEDRLAKTFIEKEDLLMQRAKLEGDLTLIKCTLSSTRGELERFQAQRLEMLSTIKDLREALQREKVRQRGGPNVPSEAANVNLRHSEVDEYKLPVESEDGTMQALLQNLQEAKSHILILESEIRKVNEESSIYRKQLEEGASGSVSFALNQISDAERLKFKEEGALLKEEIETLEAALAKERLSTTEERATLHRLQGENAKLKGDLQDAREHSERSEYTDQYYQAKIKSIHEQHDEATARLVSYEELLGAKNDEISRLKKEMGQVKAHFAELKSEGDTIAILRAQVEVYQGDFRAEREARESLANDREKLRDEVRHLHARSTQLVDELETYQRGHLPQGRSSRGGSAEPQSGFRADASYQGQQQDLSWERFSISSDKKEEPPKKEDAAVEVDEKLLYCPKCNKSFTELRPLEEHVNRCLDED